MNHATANVYERPAEIAPREWPPTALALKPRLVFLELGTQSLAHIGIRPTTLETNIQKRRHELLTTFANSTQGINIARVENFIRDQGLRVAPYRVLSEADTRHAQSMGIGNLLGGYRPSYDLALIPRRSELEAVNGPEFTESVVVHELAHGTNTYHDFVYRESLTSDDTSIKHARSGQRVHDSRGKERGRLIEEAYPERKRGQFVENVLGRPYGFLDDLQETKFLLFGDAMISKKYGIRLPNGTSHVYAESYAAQIFDLLCEVDPELDHDLTLARKSAEGLRNVARRLNRIESGLYVYLRDAPFRREDYKQRLIYVQRLISRLHNRRAGIKAGFLLAG